MNADLSRRNFSRCYSRSHTLKYFVLIYDWTRWIELDPRSNVLWVTTQLIYYSCILRIRRKQEHELFIQYLIFFLVISRFWVIGPESPRSIIEPVLSWFFVIKVVDWTAGNDVHVFGANYSVRVICFHRCSFWLNERMTEKTMRLQQSSTKSDRKSIVNNFFCAGSISVRRPGTTWECIFIVKTRTYSESTTRFV